MTEGMPAASRVTQLGLLYACIQHTDVCSSSGSSSCCSRMRMLSVTQVWCARQLTRIPGINGVTDALMSWYVKLVSGAVCSEVVGQQAFLPAGTSAALL
jgi:hypothetical protein